MKAPRWVTMVGVRAPRWPPPLPLACADRRPSPAKRRRPCRPSSARPSETSAPLAKPTPADVRAAIARAFSGFVSSPGEVPRARPATSTETVAQDVAVVVEPAEERLHEMNDDFRNWIVEDLERPRPRLGPSPSARVGEGRETRGRRPRPRTRGLAKPRGAAGLPSEGRGGSPTGLPSKGRGRLRKPPEAPGRRDRRTRPNRRGASCTGRAPDMPRGPDPARPRQSAIILPLGPEGPRGPTEVVPVELRRSRRSRLRAGRGPRPRRQRRVLRPQGEPAEAGPRRVHPGQVHDRGASGWTAGRRGGGAPRATTGAWSAWACRAVIRGVDVDTNHFVGNFPERGFDRGLLPAGRGVDARTLLGPRTDWTRDPAAARRSRADRENLFPIDADGVFTHVRLNIYPDGGVARLRVYGEVAADWPALAAPKRACRPRVDRERRPGARRERHALRLEGQPHHARARRSTWATAGRRGAAAGRDTTG